MSTVSMLRHAYDRDELTLIFDNPVSLGLHGCGWGLSDEWTGPASSVVPTIRSKPLMGYSPPPFPKSLSRKMTRYFVAISLPQDVKKAVERVRRNCRTVKVATSYSSVCPDILDCRKS